MPLFLEAGLGANNSSFIDFATSPLYYSGTLSTFMVSTRKATEKREVTVSVSASNGSYSLDYNDIEASVDLKALISINYCRLYQINAFEDSRWNLKAGGAFDLTALLRTNRALFNNGAGYEAFTNLFASGKISYDISNKEKKKFLFFNLKPKWRQLAFQLNVGVINGALRNGYIYSTSAPVYNDENIFKDYEYNLFSGFRMSSRFDYEFEIFNRNTIKVSYLWDAMKSGSDDQDPLQLVNKMVLASFNIKLR